MKLHILQAEALQNARGTSELNPLGRVRTAFQVDGHNRARYSGRPHPKTASRIDAKANRTSRCK